MPITVATAPSQSLETLNATLHNWVSNPATAPQAAAAGISFVSDQGIDVHLPHPVYTLGLDDISAGKGLAAARLISWRYLLSDGETTAMAEISQPPAQPAAAHPAAAASPAFSTLNRGPFVASLVDAVTSAETDSRLQSRNYEIATLTIPALYVVALWLRSPNPDAGTVIPLAPAPAFLNTSQHYTEDAFLAAIVAAAKTQHTTSAALV